jgi:uncharacterized protein with FMN-binding domain
MDSTKDISTRNKLVLSLGLIIASIAYSVSSRGFLGADDARVAPKPTPGQSYKAAGDTLFQTLSQLAASTSQSSTSSAPPPPQPSIIATKPAAGQYTDGSYIGSSADAYYGTVQVKAIIQNGKLANVAFLQYPNSHENSILINGEAMPLLTQEAIQAQNAQVDGVSGATFTSEAFKQSLASALVQAKK